MNTKGTPVMKLITPYRPGSTIRLSSYAAYVLPLA